MYSADGKIQFHWEGMNGPVAFLAHGIPNLWSVLHISDKVITPSLRKSIVCFLSVWNIQSQSVTPLFDKHAASYTSHIHIQTSAG